MSDKSKKKEIEKAELCIQKPNLRDFDAVIKTIEITFQAVANGDMQNNKAYALIKLLEAANKTLVDKARHGNALRIANDLDENRGAHPVKKTVGSPFSVFSKEAG